jgi:hypothetical protein
MECFVNQSIPPWRAAALSSSDAGSMDSISPSSSVGRKNQFCDASV